MDLLIPKNFNEFIINKKNATILSLFNINNLPNILIFGKKNIGKKTLIYSFIRHLYNITNIHIQEIEKQLKYSSKNYTCIFNMCDYYYEIDLLKNIKNVKYIIKDFLINLCSNSTLDNNYRIIIIHNIDVLNIDNLKSLSYLIEKYHIYNRFIIISNNSTLYYIKSKLFNLCFNVRCYLDKNEIKNYIDYYNKKYKLTDKIIKKIYNCKDLYQIQLIVKYKTIKYYNPLELYIKQIHILLINAENILFIPTLKNYIQELFLLNFNLKKIYTTYIDFILKELHINDNDIHMLYHLANKYSPSKKYFEHFSLIENFFIEVKLNILQNIK